MVKDFQTTYASIKLESANLPSSRLEYVATM